MDGPKNLFSLHEPISKRPFDGSHLYRHCPECGARWATNAGLASHRALVHVAEKPQEKGLHIPDSLLLSA